MHSQGYGPIYTDDLSRTIGVLQQLQLLLSGDAEITLSDVAGTLQQMQQRYGDATKLETVIQDLAGRHLAGQVVSRARAREEHYVTA